MNNSRGFTLVEMMVAAGILTVALAGAMSFFIFQSHKGSDSTKIRAARDNVTLALMMIQRDIMAGGFGVMGGSWDPKTLSVLIKANYGVDSVTNDVYGSKLTTFTPDKLHVGYGTFLDMNFDVNGTNDTNSVFKNSAIKNIGTSGVSTFVYDQFPVEMAVTTDTKPVGGFMCSTCAAGLQPEGSDVDWKNSGSRAAGTKTWTVKLISGSSNLSGNVAPSIVYRIAQNFGHSYVTAGIDPPYELQRNGVRIAGGDPGMEVYNLKVTDDSSPNKRRFLVRIDYQVKLGASKDENGSHGTAKNTWHKGYVTIKADPRVIMLNGG
jgi:prepilin-type N-terminal cleavage/methylation domain-containing protein